ncbi:tudor domain-containing protein 3 isoform X2 [Glycine soja]|uniref:Tudor domain-containing protein 3 n=1 Tax=Glycine soja TaxID=3848 RepID=A0A445KCN7_GLYSO|nr:tudor domain-containing protein 3 isoform X2 [Glycine soja]RZC08586.1 Tudor domain-containing protein 3 [Glycine soja]
MMEENSRGWDSGGMVLETLRKRGWCLEDTDRLKAIIDIQSALADDRSKLVDSVESELLNSDLRSIAAKSLPQPSLLRNASTFLHGPKVLQISSVRDISKSSVDEFLKNSGDRRVLRLCLTDGHYEITAVEYSHIPSIPDNVVPGTKIRLENKVAVHNGIVCLNPKVLTVLGGVVQSLYEEWEMNQKYSGFSRSSLRKLENRDTGGPPQFVKLQVGSSSDYNSSRSRKPVAVVGEAEMRPTSTADYNSSRSRKPIAVVGEAGLRPTDFQQDPNQKADANLQSKPPQERAEDKASSSSGTRPKEVVESVPVQNQAAAQKLLQKLNHPSQNDRHHRGWKHRGKGKQEDPVVFTLEEYENRKAQTKPSIKDWDLDISRDEHLARQLQNQLDLEDSRVGRGTYEDKAQDIRMSMFAYERDSDSSHQMGQGGRGRGRGRGKGRGRGRGRHG